MNGYMSRQALLRDKYREAEFFLNGMRETDDIDSVGHNDAFRFYFSGFLGAVYAIECYFKETGDHSRFHKWADSDAERDLHEFLIDRRTDVVHLGAADTPDDSMLRLTTADLTGDEPCHAFPGDVLPASVTDEYGHKAEDSVELLRVTEVCREYLSLVDEWLTEWESRE